MTCKRAKFLVLLLAALLLFAGCAQKVSVGDIAGKTYVYEKGGFGGHFTVTLKSNGKFTYYEGGLSSYIGSGNWELNGDTVTIRDDGGMGIFNFRVEGEDLVFIADGSFNFNFVKVADGEKFSPDDGTRNLRR